ncbi:hypothetical protein C943_04216 [Mariniradius saccharolyticus AK6]|uniref:Uncharacterized protein n=1 Tax=Mariniradius saccharolyticus AK6 TaxID=1239962 RepID=M7XZI9_9BACT|nr:hypothetical protein C943_04216 [Mariniradius saccharolyticus AK6]
MEKFKMINDQFTSPRPSPSGEGADANRRYLFWNEGFKSHRDALIVEKTASI